MRIDFSQLNGRQAYQHLIRLIVPRPIAWVSTVSPAGVANLAPFSFYNGVTGNPPTVLFCPANDRHGKPKDTLRNIEATGEFVINVVDRAHGDLMNATSAPLPPEESEFAKCGVPSVASDVVRPPRVATAPAAIECTLHQVVRVGEGPGSGNVVIGVVRVLHIDDRVLGADGEVDNGLLDAIGRLGGDDYATTRERFTLVRPW